MVKKTSIALILAAFVLIIIYLFPKEMISPGKLLEEHRDLETNCLECHTLFAGVPGEKCIACHKPEEIGGTAGAKGGIEKGDQGEEAIPLFHAKFTADTCLSCHTEHRGIESEKYPQRFSHGLLEENDRRACASCHEKPDNKLHKEFSGKCAECHDTEDWKGADFDHNKYFRFDREHKSDCASCHTGASYKDYTCYECHSQRKMEGEHREEGIRDSKNCVACHRSGDEHEAKRNYGNSGPRYGTKEKGEKNHREDDD